MPVSSPRAQLLLSKRLTQRDIQLYAEASGDFNPIHVDEVFASRTPFGGTIAHGMLGVGYISEMMTAEFGRRWIGGGILRVKFKAPARPGDVLTITGERQEDETVAGKTYARYGVFCRNQKQEVIIEGQALVDIQEQALSDEKGAK